MALADHHRLLNKLRSFLATYLVSYDPFGEKLVEHFRLNPSYPFTSTESFTFEYSYRRWSTIYFLIGIQIFVFIVAIYCYCQIPSTEYWASSSKLIFLFSLGLGTIFLCFNLIENLKPIRIVLAPLDFRVSIYIADQLRQHSPIDRAYICLHQIKSYNVLLYHLVFIIEDVDYIHITDYFSYQFQLRQIGKRLAQNLYIGYLENEHWMGIFPKYLKLRKYIKHQRTVNAVNKSDRRSTWEENDNTHFQRKRSLLSCTAVEL